MPQSPPVQDQVPKQMRIRTEIPLDHDMLEPELTPSPVAGDHGSHDYLGLFYRVDVEALGKWANVTNFIMGGLGFSVKKSEITLVFLDLLLIMYGKKWEKRVLRYTKMVKEQLKALIPGICKLTIHQTNSGWSDLIIGLFRQFESSLRDWRSPGGSWKESGSFGVLRKLRGSCPQHTSILP